MFEFYDNIYSGTIKRKQNIVQFFQNCVPKLSNAIKNNFIYELQDLLQNWRSKQDISTQSTLKLKVYDDKEKEIKNIHKKVVRNVETKLEKESIQGLLKKNFNLNFEVTVEDNVDKENQVENEIEDFFQDNRPKNKGWLFRKSKKHQNKWSNLFFYIYHDNSHLVSVKPTSLKREIDCENIELYKCSFIDLLDYQETKKACMERRKFRNKNFMSVTEGEKQNTYTNSNDAKISNNQLQTQSMAVRKNELSNFFLYDKSSKKSYLIRSEESLIIMTLQLNEKNDSDTKAKIAEYAQLYSEYSGIIEIAICNKKQIVQSYTDLSSFSFKKQYLIVKQDMNQLNLYQIIFKIGKLRIYNMKQKDKINLMEYELKIDSRLPFVPSNPFSFMLEKVIKPENNGDEEAKKKEEQMASQQSSVVMFNPQSNINNENGIRQSQPNNYNMFEKNLKGDFNNTAPKNILNQKNMSYNQNSQQQTPPVAKQGFFQKILQKIYKKSPDRLVIASDSEYKRKQWIFTINFHKTMLVRMKKKNKASFGYQQSFNTNQFFSNLNTLENEFGQTLFPLNTLTGVGGVQLTNPSFHQQQLALVKKARQSNRTIGSGEYKQNGQTQPKVNLKLSEIEGDNDYYDIFAQKDVVEEVKEEDEEHNDDSPKLVPYKYNPNDYKDKMFTTQAAQAQTLTQTQNVNYKRQGSAQNPTNHLNTQSNNRTNVQKQSIVKTTEEGMYTMSFPQSNHFKKSLLLYDNQNLIINSKEIRTFTDEEIWQKFLKHFLVFNHQFSEIDLSTFGPNGGDNLHNAANNLSYQKSPNYTQPLSKSTPMSRFINHPAFVFSGQENQYEQGEQHIQSLDININQFQDYQNNELQSNKQPQNIQKINLQQESTIYDDQDCYAESYNEPCAQQTYFTKTRVHKQY